MVPLSTTTGRLLKSGHVRQAQIQDREAGQGMELTVGVAALAGEIIKRVFPIWNHLNRIGDAPLLESAQNEAGVFRAIFDQ